MRKVLFLALALAVLAGCKKPSGKTNPNPPQGNTGGPGVHGPTAVVTNPALGGGGGGSGGAAQAVRNAVVRSVNKLDLRDIHLFIETSSSADGRMPGVEEIRNALRQSGAGKIDQKVAEGVIVLTGARQRESVWAYSADPQPGGYWVATNSGIEQMTEQALDQRLAAQGHKRPPGNPR
jgi:type IV pilus biogenesis protein CpaD/CtpE